MSGDRTVLKCTRILDKDPFPVLRKEGSAVAWWLMPRTPDPEVEVRAPLGSSRVVSLRKAHLLPESTGNTQDVVAPSKNCLPGRKKSNQPTNLRKDVEETGKTLELGMLVGVDQILPEAIKAAGDVMIDVLTSASATSS